MFNRLRFHNQLILIFSLGIIILALVTAFVVTDVSKDAVRERIFDESLSLVENLSKQSTLSLLYQSPESAKDVTNIFSDFPDVSGIAILNKDFSQLYGYGESHITEVSPNLINEKARLIFDSEESWVFSAPVLAQKNNESEKDNGASFFAPPEESIFDIDGEPDVIDEKAGGINATVNATEIIGYVQLIVSKESLESISFEIFRYNIFVSLVLAIFLLIILLFITQKVTRPMAKLSETMRVAQGGELLVRADMDGPRDVFEIKKAFNSMMDQLERREKQIKQARDEAYESAAEKARFAANVSHELRTPMNGVLGMLDLLPENGLTSTQLEYVRIAKKSAQSLLSLIDDVLDFSKNDSLSIMLESKSFNIIELLDELTALLGLKAQSKHIDFCYEVQDDVPTILEGDVEKIRQVLINLMGNAIKFTLSGTVSVVVKQNIDMCSKEQDKMPISFSVIDTGVGVSEDAKEKIFDAFVQVDNSPSRQFGGTGLGLAISRQLVDILDGDLSVSSEEGVGSEFSFTIPLTPISKLRNKIEPSFSVKSCLIVTGNAVFARSLSSMLSPVIEKIWVVDNASEALQFVGGGVNKPKPIDIIILDDNVHKDFDFFCTIKNQQLLANVALVLVGYEASQLSERVFQPDMFLTKPILRINLFGFIQERFSDKSIQLKEKNVFKIQEQDNTKLQGKRILVVEDIDTNWLVTKGMLNTMGCNADIARNGKEGVEKIKNGNYDLILMDCHMPIMDGYSATSLIRKMEKNTADHNVIIAMTANNLSGEKEKCFAAGMDDFLSKPLSRVDLKNVLLHWLGQEKTNKKPITKSHINNKVKMIEPAKKIPDNVVDASKMMELKSQMGDAMPTLVASFVSHMEEHIANLDSALKHNDTRKVKFIAHAIKGSASNFGATNLVAKSKELESSAEHLSLQESEEAIRVVAYEGRLVVDYLRNL